MAIPNLTDSLSKLFPPERLLHQAEDLVPYSFDGTAALRKMPAVVVFPEEASEVQAIVRLAAKHRIPLVARGSGTGLSGGSVPVDGAAVVCMVRMDRILEFDRANLTMLVEPGVITQTVSQTAEAVGLFYPPDPGSMKVSTIGGNVAENSGGLRGLKYGVTRDYVMGLEVVLASGEIAWLGSKCVKDVAGYSMKDVFVGSEGTLGIITKILLKLLPKPLAKRTLLAIYDDMESAAETVSALIAEKVIPCTLEFLDRMTIRCVEDFAKVGLPRDAEALLLVETDGHPAAVEAEALLIEKVALRLGARQVTVAASEAEATQLATARRSAFAALARIAPTTILEDATVPRSELPKMVRFCSRTAEKYALKLAVFGHMGDGNLHPTFLTDERNAEEMHRVEEAMREVFDYALSLGGTVTGEHGVGLAKKSFLPRQFSEASLSLLRNLKRTLDPEGILNPGKIFDP